MRKYRIKQIDSFTEMVFGGNPAGVVLKAEGLSDNDMQNIAAEMNLSETAFILPSEKSDFRMRWFTPEKEVLFCGHATVASLHALAEEGEFGMDKDGEFNFNIETMIGIIPITVLKSSPSIKIILQSPEINLIKEKIDINNLINALDIRFEDVDHFYPVMRDRTLDYVYLVLKNLSALKRVSYDYDKLKNFGNKHGIKGFIILSKETFHDESDVHSRFFTPYYGIREDPVTGSAQGPLGVYLVLNGMVKMTNNILEINSEQGDFMGRPGRLKVRIIKNKNGLFTSELIGKAVTVLDGELIL